MTFRVVITARPMFARGSSRMELVIDYDPLIRRRESNLILGPSSLLSRKIKSSFNLRDSKRVGGRVRGERSTRTKNFPYYG